MRIIIYFFNFLLTINLTIQPGWSEIITIKDSSNKVNAKTSNQSNQINKTGKIIYSKKENSFYFIYEDKNKENVYLSKIYVRSKKEFNQLQKVASANDVVTISGNLNWIENKKNEFSNNNSLSLLLDISDIKKNNLSEYNLSELRYIPPDDPNYYEQFRQRRFRVAEEENFHYGSSGMSLPDNVCYTTIGASAIVLGIAVGPVVIVPAALLGLKVWLLDD